MRAPPSALPTHNQLNAAPTRRGVKLPRTCQNNRAADDPHGRMCIKGNIKSVDNFFKKKRDLNVQQLQTTNIRSKRDKIRCRTTNLPTDEQADTQDHTPSRRPIIFWPYMHREPTHNGPITSTLLRIRYTRVRLRRRWWALTRCGTGGGRLRRTLHLLRGEVTKWTITMQHRRPRWKPRMGECRWRGPCRLVVRARADRCLSPVCACWCEQVWRREYAHAWCSHIAQSSAPESDHRFGYSVEQIGVPIPERNCAIARCMHVIRSQACKLATQ